MIKNQLEFFDLTVWCVGYACCVCILYRFGFSFFFLFEIFITYVRVHVLFNLSCCFWRQLSTLSNVSFCDCDFMCVTCESMLLKVFSWKGEGIKFTLLLCVCLCVYARACVYVYDHKSIRQFEQFSLNA